MNEYQVMWDVCGYGARRQRILSTEASESRKHCALQRLWRRMLLTVSRCDAKKILGRPRSLTAES